MSANKEIEYNHISNMYMYICKCAEFLYIYEIAKLYIYHR